MSTTMTLVVLTLGALGGLGLWLAVTASRSRRTSVLVRVAPWVSDVSPDAHRVAIRALASGNRARRAWAHNVMARLPGSTSEVLAGGERTRLLLRRAGRDESAMHWSARLIESAVFGALIGLGLGGLLLWLAHGSLVAPLALAAVGAGGGVAIAKYTLNRRASQRSALVLEELPAVCELLAICLTAGEGFPEALQRISARGEGPLVRELRRVLVAAGMGVPLAQGLGELAARLDLAPLSRTLDHVIASLERGAPLADVLRTQAAEARAEAGRRLQERASAREVVMLLPLVFLILPITIAFAVFPGLLVIQAGL